MGIIQLQFSFGSKPEFSFCSLCSFGLDFKNLTEEPLFKHCIEVYFFRYAVLENSPNAQYNIGK